MKNRVRTFDEFVNESYTKINEMTGEQLAKQTIKDWDLKPGDVLTSQDLDDLAGSMMSHGDGNFDDIEWEFKSYMEDYGVKVDESYKLNEAKSISLSGTIQSIKHPKNFVYEMEINTGNGLYRVVAINSNGYGAISIDRGEKSFVEGGQIEISGRSYKPIDGWPEGIVRKDGKPVPGVEIKGPKITVDGKTIKFIDPNKVGKIELLVPEELVN